MNMCMLMINLVIHFTELAKETRNNLAFPGNIESCYVLKISSKKW